MLDYFNFYLLPLSIRIGMTPDQFWNGDPDYFWSYWDAYVESKKQQIREQNNFAFTQGQYFMLAISHCFQDPSHKKQIYPKEPFNLGFDKKIKMTQEEYQELRKAQIIEMTKRFNNK